MQPDPRLHEGEEILWQGTPDVSAWWTRVDLFFVPLTVLWLGFAVFWTVSAASSIRGPHFMWIFGLVFVAIGVYMAIGRFFVKAARKRRTRYFLTNRRAIVVDPSGTHHVGLTAAAIVSSIHRNGKHVDVTFGAEEGTASTTSAARVQRMYANTGMDFLVGGSGLPFAFYDVADVTGLEDALAARESA